MSFFLILFLASLFGIVLLVGRKILVLKNGEMHAPTDFDFTIEVPDFEEVKRVAYKKSRRYGYIALVLTIRTYVLSVHVVREKSKKLAQEVKKRIAKKTTERKSNIEVENKFLKRISEYKNRIRQIKEKIKEEEGLN